MSSMEGRQTRTKTAVTGCGNEAGLGGMENRQKLCRRAHQRRQKVERGGTRRAEAWEGGGPPLRGGGSLRC